MLEIQCRADRQWADSLLRRQVRSSLIGRPQSREGVGSQSQPLLVVVKWKGRESSPRPFVSLS